MYSYYIMILSGFVLIICLKIQKSCCEMCSMAKIQNGVSEKSKMFFYCGAQKGNLFYYPISCGHFYCNSDYRIDRQHFDSILITYIIRGSFTFLSNEKECTAHANETAIVNCFAPHVYYTNDSFEAYWIHINGGATAEMYEGLIQRRGNVIPSNKQTEAQIKALYDLIKNGEMCSDSTMSLKIYALLTGLFDDSEEKNASGGAVANAIDFLTAHYNKPLSVRDIATVTHMSDSQFSRIFKKQTGSSPYDFLLHIRLTKAKELLKNTNLPISEIAYRTGFSSDSNFICFFKQQEGISPLKFRKMLF